ncbi:hypothetical protein B0H14DRAFT_2584581 [Mycena olivaceomarginata]|nr:hypothetical protein B0H14DRAFT_2584581 [Mycena olivaceomarginata]
MLHRTSSTSLGRNAAHIYLVWSPELMRIGLVVLVVGGWISAFTHAHRFRASPVSFVLHFSLPGQLQSQVTDLIYARHGVSDAGDHSVPSTHLLNDITLLASRPAIYDITNFHGFNLVSHRYELNTNHATSRVATLQIPVFALDIAQIFERSASEAQGQDSVMHASPPPLVILRTANISTEVLDLQGTECVLGALPSIFTRDTATYSSTAAVTGLGGLDAVIAAVKREAVVGFKIDLKE